MDCNREFQIFPVVLFSKNWDYKWNKINKSPVVTCSEYQNYESINIQIIQKFFCLTEINSCKGAG